jgi:hypothetical protein
VYGVPNPDFSKKLLNLSNLGKDTGDGSEDTAGNTVDVADEAVDVADNRAGGSADDTFGKGQDRGEQRRNEDQNGLDLGLDGSEDI